ncbi:Nucleotidylyl transferase [Serendipita vermifera]|nr:Nucleotidylyl transferase [Serendipita vermifera]
MLRLTISSLPIKLSRPLTTVKNPDGGIFQYRYLSTFGSTCSSRSMSTASSTSPQYGDGSIEILDSLPALRAWRERARKENKDVGFVPTMGALHQGHLDLVRHSLRQNPLTVVSIFVNPAQFAPHEDLATYPRTLNSDMEKLQEVVESISSSDASITRKPSAVFIPPVQVMYPSGITQDVEKQKGTFVQIKGYEHEMEGKSRPGFFRGVATVVTKLFNAVEPTHAYFGQKDIQQALLLRRLTSDLLLSHPTPSNLHIIPTYRDPVTGLALSSRNAYLTDKERQTWAPVLWKSLQEGKKVWRETLEACYDQGRVAGGPSGIQCAGLREKVKGAAERIIIAASVSASKEDPSVTIKLDYIELNWVDTFEPVESFTIDPSSSQDGGLAESPEIPGTPAMILSGAMWVGRTRLIDNILLGDTKDIIG